MKIGIRQKIIIPLLVLMCIVLVWFILLYYPQKKKLKNLTKQIEAIQIKHALLAGTLLSSSHKTTEKINLIQRYNELKRLLPRKESISSILAPLSKTGSQKNIDILSIKPLTFQLFEDNDQGEEHELKEIPIEIRLSGRFIDIGDYLFTLSALPFFGGYKSIHIDISDKIYPKTEAEITCVLLLFKSLSKPDG
ncbi:MAG: type 4a pilus biogenesis protein PilO [bacterium]